MLRKDLTGMTFNNWYVIRIDTDAKYSNTSYICKCMLCGTEKSIRDCTLKSGRSKMCRKCSAKLSQHRKYTGDPITKIFSGMWQRCYDKNQINYHNYGGRGIKICDEWLNNREAFYGWAYENGYTRGLSIERVDVNGDYCPENCKFIPIKDQPKNRRDTHNITINGVTKCLSDWCRELHVDRHTVKRRYDSGMTWEDALHYKD